MASTKKKGGLGAESYFENIPTLEPEENEEPLPETKDAGENFGAKPDVSEDDSANLDSQEVSEPQRQKIRRTYALYEETQIALEEMKLAARKQGMKITLGDLLEEAVQLLMEKKGMSSQEIISE